MLETGTTLAGYRVDGVLGQGGMGVVYEATQLSLNRTVALKLLAAHLGDDPGFRERFRREGQIQAAIDHPNIITVFEAGETEHGLFLAMRLIRGPNLKDMIVGRELDAGRTMRVLRPVADALESAHGAGLIHRDIKPQNILVGARDHPWLADFGLTKAPTEKSLTRTGQFVGTLDYIAPEQIQGKRATAKADVYAFAAVLYECLTGVVPFPKESEAAVLYAHLSDDPPSVSDERPELPAGLDQVIRKGMAKDPERRFDSPMELVEEAERSFTRRLRAALTPPGPIEVPEETGIREAEAAVETRETPSPPAPETRARPTEEAPPAEETRPAAAAPVTPVEETRPAEGITDPAETAAAASVVTPAAADETRPAIVAETRRAGTSGVAAQPTTAAAGAPASAPARPLPERMRLTPAVLGVAGAVLLIAAIAGFVLGGSGDEQSGSPGEFANTASAGTLEIGFPGSWQRTSDNPAVPGIRFEDPIKLGRPDEQGERLTTGQVDASGPALLPRSFVRRLPGGKAPPRDDAVRLGDLEAYRYPNLRPRGFGRSVTLYVSPTTRGVATVACISPEGSVGDFSPACEEIATSLNLTSGRGYDLGPNDEYASSVDRTIERLNSQVSRGKTQLGNARTPAGQAKRSASLAGAYAAAGRQLGRLDVSPADRDAHVAIVGALRRTSSAYTAMSRAAARGNRGPYNRARAAARRGEAAVQRALSSLRALGYRPG